MNSIKNITVVATLSAIFSIVSLASAQAAQETMKPLQGLSFHAGTKHAVGYFLSDNGTCKLVLTLADEVNFAPTSSSRLTSTRVIRRTISSPRASRWFLGAAPMRSRLAFGSLETTAGN